MANRPTSHRFIAEPVHQPEYAPLTLTELRTVRGRMREEEASVSYWRRIVQARMDLACAPEAATGVAGLSRALVASLGHDLDMDLLPSPRAVTPDESRHPLPDLPLLQELWQRVVGVDGALDARTCSQLHDAEAELSSYRLDLHRRLNRATCELMARYREEPQLCLSVLPLVAVGTVPSLAG